MNTFMVPHILRCSRHESGIFINDGFYVVSFGMVRVLPTSLEIMEYEHDNGGERNGWAEIAEPVLRV